MRAGQCRPQETPMHVRRHVRFYLACAAGVAAGLAAAGLEPAMRLLLGGDTFFAVYLALTGHLLAQSTANQLRRQAADEDEGLALILALTATAVVLSLFLILHQLNQPGGALRGVLTFASVAFGWLTLHTLWALHYANLHYAPKSTGAKAGGLAFPETNDPGPWDFLYFSFVIGMTAQVSDVAIRTTRLRRAALAHGILSFLYNTVILALAVNAAVTYAK
jgi:uncharacterized membrane protein